MIKQNKNIEEKIYQLQKEYLDENNNSGNSFIYLESIKEYMNKLNSKEEEINMYKKQIKILTMKLKEKANEISKKNELLKKYVMYNREGSINLLKSNNYETNMQNSCASHTHNEKWYVVFLPGLLSRFP